MSFKVKYEFKNFKLGNDFFKSKRHLIDCFFGDFYDFIIEKGGINDLLSKNIKSRKEFVEFAIDWYADGMENCYGVGFGFHKYYLTQDEIVNLDKQPTDTYIGYLHKNNKYPIFINFLITFFAWWRNDEHCTCFDPYNYADQFFGSTWATLVDTAKLFYFTAETVFGWISYRVKYALDNIPGVILSNYENEVTYEKEVTLEKIRVAGYEFLGWFDKDGNIVTKASSDMTVYADFKRKDIYDYWEKEEKTIKKVITPDSKRVDPA